jgi:hypothetical protein
MYPTDETPVTKSSVLDLKLPDSTVAELVKSRRSAAESHWERKYKLKQTRKDNKKLYNTEYAKDQPRDIDEGPLSVDNRLFVAVRVLVPYLTDRLAQPEVTPANGSDLAREFAQDFEKVLVKVATKSFVKERFRLMVQDLFEGQRKGVGKWYYDPIKKKLCFKRLDPENVLVGHRSELYDEPEFVEEKQKRTIGELFKQFPDKKTDLKVKLGVGIETPAALDKEIEITETWLFVDDVQDERQLAIVWMYQGVVLGSTTDPNYDHKGENIIDEQTTPYVFVNILNDGSGYEDETSYIEQAQYSQKSYDRDAQTISDDAAYGGSGVPVVAKGAIEDEDLAKLRFKPSQRLSLDTDDVGKSFTTWQKPPLDQSIFLNKKDARDNVDNTFGTPAIFQGKETDSATATQDVMLRDSAQGRQTDAIDCLDAAMRRCYQIMAQLVMRYYTDEDYYKFVEDGQFMQVMLTNDALADNAGMEIDVEAGSSLPVNRDQKRAITLQLLQLGKMSTLRAYKELGVEDPEGTFKDYMLEMAAPDVALENVDKEAMDRDAKEDLYVVIDGKVPEERDDITPEYVSYLNNWLTTDKYRKLTPAQQQAVSAFVQMIVQKAQLKIAKLATQEPLPPGAPGGPALPPPPPEVPPGGPQGPSAPATPDVGAMPSMQQAPAPDATAPLPGAAAVLQ